MNWDLLVSLDAACRFLIGPGLVCLVAALVISWSPSR
jgi:hypothetical protein